MNEIPSSDPLENPFTRFLFEKLRNHPKRIVFTEGEDPRVVQAARRLVELEAAAPILLGNPDTMRAIAAEQKIPLDFIRLLDPRSSSDFALFCRRFEKIERYKRLRVLDPAEIVARPQYFGALMVQYGQADALVGGNQVLPLSLYRALLNTIKPLPHVPRVFSTMLLVGNPHLENFGAEGALFLADCAMILKPDVPQLAAIAVETGKLARHFLGRAPSVALLSHSTHGSAPSEDARRMAAATALARDKAMAEHAEMRIDGELQADVALDPLAAAIKLPEKKRRHNADVLVFPNLDAAHISIKLLRHVAGTTNYGHIVMGLARPAAQVPRTASANTILGTAAVVGLKAINFHDLYPDGEVD
jgi:phosphotransacetylase